MPPDVDPQEALRELAWEMRYSKVLDGPPGWIPPLERGSSSASGIRSGAVETVALDRRDVAGPHVGVVGAQVARLARLVIGPDPGWPGPPAVAMEELLELVATEAPELLHQAVASLLRGGRAGRARGPRRMGRPPGADWHAEDRATPLGRAQAWGFRPDDIVH